MAGSVVEICNLALSHAAAGGPIASLTEASEPARACRLNYGPSRQTLLRAHPWGFAARRRTLALLASGDPASGYQYRYQYPSDCVALRAVLGGGVASRWVIGVSDDGAARVVDTDAVAAVALYTADVEAVALFDPLFTESLAWLLASRLAMPLTGKRDVMRDCWQVYQQHLQSARTHDAQEDLSRPDVAPVPDWIRARG